MNKAIFMLVLATAVSAESWRIDANGDGKPDIVAPT